MPHGGVLQNQWMKVLERLCSGTSGWPRIRCSMQPPPLPSLPSLWSLSLIFSRNLSTPLNLRYRSTPDTSTSNMHRLLSSRCRGYFRRAASRAFRSRLKTRVIRLRGIFCSALMTRRLKPCKYVYDCIELGLHCDDTSVKLLYDPTRLN